MLSSIGGKTLLRREENECNVDDFNILSIRDLSLNVQHCCH
jgi:hypothetical protein